MHLPQVGEWLVVRLVTACPNLTNLSLGMHTSITDSGLRKILASNRWNSFLESCWVLLVEEQNPNWEKLIRAINYIISFLSLSELRHFKCTQSKHLSMESVSMLLDSCKVRAQSYMEDIIHKVLRTDFSNNFARTLSPVSSWTPGLVSPLRSWKTQNSGWASILIIRRPVCTLFCYSSSYGFASFLSLPFFLRGSIKDF